MSKTKQENNQPPKYQELNDFELEIICGGSTVVINSKNNLCRGEYYDSDGKLRCP